MNSAAINMDVYLKIMCVEIMSFEGETGDHHVE
jgi:hypothetical protein